MLGPPTLHIPAYSCSPLIEHTTRRHAGHSKLSYAILRWLIGTLRPAFPRRVRAYYAKGSYTDGTDVPPSAIDLTIVFKDRFLSDHERRHAVHAFATAPGTVEPDVDIVDEAELAGGVEPSPASRALPGHRRRPRSQRYGPNFAPFRRGFLG